MSYRSAMEDAGAQVLEFNEFGDYQGSWLAKVVYNGETLLITGSYGSCSGCDSFQSEFSYESHEHPPAEGERHRRYIYVGDGEYVEGCSICDDYKRRIADFGRTYLEAPANPELYRKTVAEDLSWDSDAKDMMTWLDQHFPLVEAAR